MASDYIREKYIEPAERKRLRSRLIQILRVEILEKTHYNSPMYTRNSTWIMPNTEFNDACLTMGESVWKGESDILPNKGHVMWDYIVFKRGDLLWRIFITSGNGIQISLLEKGEKIREKIYDYHTSMRSSDTLKFRGKEYDIYSDKWNFDKVLAKVCVEHMIDCRILEDIADYVHDKRGQTVATKLGILESKKKFKSYDEYNSAGTENYEPPKYLVQPAEGDKGWAYVRGEFDKKKTRFTPKIDW